MGSERLAGADPIGLIVYDGYMDGRMNTDGLRAGWDGGRMKNGWMEERI